MSTSSMRDLAGPAGKYAVAAEKSDFNAMTEAVLAVISADEIVLPHPEHPDIACRCVSSHHRMMSNFLFLSDQNGDNRWCLVQNTRFFRQIITAESDYTISGRRDALDDWCAALVRSGELDGFWERHDSFGGIFVDSDRPFHFFYDQFLELPDILPAVPLHRRVVHAGKNSYMSPSLVWGVSEASVQEGCYYVLPCIAGEGHLRWHDRQAHYEKARRVEAEIAAAIPARARSAETDLVLWIGITGQKRKWQEQVEGYGAIIRTLSMYFPRLHVCVDGWTASHGTRLTKRDDEAVLRQIIALVDDCAHIESLIGADYASKIAVGHAVDVFIANGGGGSFCPMRICRKPGVIHSNTKLWMFKDDPFEQDVVFLDSSVITDDPSCADAPPPNLSYSIRWQDIYDPLTTLVSRVTGRPVPAAPSET